MSIVTATIAITPVGFWARGNIEAFNIDCDTVIPVLIEKRERLVRGSDPIIMPIERAELAKLLFQDA